MSYEADLLAGKAALSHTHTASAVTDFNTAADARVTAGIATHDADVAAHPSILAAIDALSGGGSSEGLWDFWNYMRLASTSNLPHPLFQGAAISSGTNNGTIPTSTILGYNPHGVFIRSSTSANAGYRYYNSSFITDFFGTISHKFRAQFAWTTSFTGRTVRMGYHDSSTVADAVDGAYFEIVNDVCSAKTANNSSRTANATTLTLSLDTPYTFEIDVNAAGTSARFRVWGGTNETALLDVANTTNIPTTQARAFQSGFVATESSTSQSDIGVLYGIGFGTIEAFQKATGRT